MDHELHVQTSSAKLPRRRFLRDAMLTTAASGFASTFVSACNITSGHVASTSLGVDTMDQALEMMARLAPLTNHGPMAAEALMSLGRADSVVTFVTAYMKRFTSAYPPPFLAVTSQNWRDALGDGRRVADWTNFFNRELKEAPWPHVLEKWSAVLAPGLAAAAAHGLIRTSHAVRSLSVNDTDLRRRELAEGLGYWAAYYQTLPEAQKPGLTKFKPAEAINHVPLLPTAERGGGSIMLGLRRLDRFAPFAGASALIETSGKPEHVISELTETFANAYLRNVTPRSLVTLIHTITSISGLRSLLPYLSPATTEKVLHFGWQVGAALYSIAAIGSTNVLPPAPEIKIDTLVERAVANGDEHAIKFTEACLREYSHKSNPIFLQAAQDALSRIRPV